MTSVGQNTIPDLTLTFEMSAPTASLLENSQAPEFCSSLFLIIIHFTRSSITSSLSTFANPASNRCSFINRNAKSVDMRYSLGRRRVSQNRLATKWLAFRLDSKEKRAACFQFRNWVCRWKHHMRAKMRASEERISTTMFSTQTTLWVLRLARTQCMWKSKGQSESDVLM